MILNDPEFDDGIYKGIALVEAHRKNSPIKIPNIGLLVH